VGAGLVFEDTRGFDEDARARDEAMIHGNFGAGEDVIVGHRR
jgi:hypothetical protein